MKRVKILQIAILACLAASIASAQNYCSDNPNRCLQVTRGGYITVGGGGYDPDRYDSYGRGRYGDDRYSYGGGGYYPPPNYGGRYGGNTFPDPSYGPLFERAASKIGFGVSARKSKDPYFRADGEGSMWGGIAALVAEVISPTVPSGRRALGQTLDQRDLIIEDAEMRNEVNRKVARRMFYPRKTERRVQVEDDDDYYVE